MDRLDCLKRHCTVLHKQKGARDAWGQVDLLALLQTCRVMCVILIPLLCFADEEQIRRGSGCSVQRKHLHVPQTRRSAEVIYDCPS